MDLFINSRDLFIVSAAFMTYATGAALWACLAAPSSALNDAPQQQSTSHRLDTTPNASI